MTLNRIMLRMAIVSALANFGRAPWPTAAGALIFDSKIEPSEQLEMNDSFQKPIAVVYTDYDKDFVLFRNKLQSKRLVTVTIELLMVQASQEIHDDDDQPTGTYELEAPTTDSELEMSLDLFERQVFETMMADTPAGDFVNTFVMGYENIISRRGAATNGGQRLAARQTTIELDLARDPKPGVVPDVTRKLLETIRDAQVPTASGSQPSDFSHRAALLLKAYEDPRGIDEFGFQRKAMGMTGQVAEDVLAIPRRPYRRMPVAPKITWVKNDARV